MVLTALVALIAAGAIYRENAVVVWVGFVALAMLMAQGVLVVLPRLLPYLWLESDSVEISPEIVDIATLDEQLHAAAALHEAGEFDQAAQICDQILEFVPGNQVVSSVLAQVRIGQGRYREARDLSLRGLTHSFPTAQFEAIWNNNLAWINFLLDDPGLLPEADVRSAYAMSLLPEHPAVLGTRGAIMIAVGRPAEGLLLLQTAFATTTKPSSRALNACMLAIGSANLGKVAQSSAWLRRARELDPSCALLAKAEDLLGLQRP